MSKREIELPRVNSLSTARDSDDYVRIVSSDSSKLIKYSDFVADLSIKNDIQSVSSLEALDDVNITNPQQGDILEYDGTNWVNTPLDTYSHVYTIKNLSSDYTITNFDMGAYFRYSGSGTITITIPDGLVFGGTFEVFNAGDGAIQFDTGANVTLVPNTVGLIEPYDWGRFVNTSAQEWFVMLPEIISESTPDEPSDLPS